MPGLCPYFLRFLKDLAGPEQGGTLAPGAESGGGVGVGGGGPIMGLGNCSFQRLPKPWGRGRGVVIEQPLSKELPDCFLNFIIFSGI